MQKTVAATAAVLGMLFLMIRSGFVVATGQHIWPVVVSFWAHSSLLAADPKMHKISVRKENWTYKHTHMLAHKDTDTDTDTGTQRLLPSHHHPHPHRRRRRRRQWLLWRRILWVAYFVNSLVLLKYVD